jgi:UDP-2,3-diacylglucosamine hydrolase
MQDRKLYYFISDVHLGLKAFDPVTRERNFAKFLNGLPEETAEIYLLGDIFDFWYEYKYVIPNGFARTLGAFAGLHDRGVKLYFINGNHDVWTFNYLQREIGFIILNEMTVKEIEGARFCLAHGDELTGEPGQKILKNIFRSRFLQMLFSAIHPRWAFALASRWSKHNRLNSGVDFRFRGDEDPLFKVAAGFEEHNRVDYFIFGHMHTAGDCLTPKGAGFYILGEWIFGCDYLVFNSEDKTLKWERSGCCNQNIE